AAASPSHRYLTDGMEQADSWATDAHKWLNVPYDSGIAFVAQPADLAASMAITADYLITDTEHRNPSDYTPELSRRGRGIDVWAALRSLGRTGVEHLVDRCCQHARRFAQGFAEAGFEILNDVVLNQVLVSFGDDAATRRVIDAIQRDGTCWCGATVWHGKTAMRISVSSWATTGDDVEKSLRAMIPIARRLAKSPV
ncbi:MAG: pyridoxal-dependent decarboxylase, partial [Gammaproteobacteria bacterium]|nr:pyridoxal-dependent decarboxylase [Gammaproteobacteria bacterium]